VNSSIVLHKDQSKRFEDNQQRIETAATDIFISPSYLQTQKLPRD